MRNIIIIGIAALVVLIIVIIVLLTRKEKDDNIYIDIPKKDKYKIINNPVGDKYDPGIMPNDKYPKQDNDINNMF